MGTEASTSDGAFGDAAGLEGLGFMVRSITRLAGVLLPMQRFGGGGNALEAAIAATGNSAVESRATGNWELESESRATLRPLQPLRTAKTLPPDRQLDPNLPL